MIRKYLLLLALGVCSFAGFAQKSYNEQAQDYIDQFKDLAMAEQQRTGIPAAITLAQGIFETAAGSSELCTNASNHFGIKCKNTWTGETYTYTDDAKDECFRKYASAVHSYKDHSDFLKNNKRYSSLFLLPPTDYAAWAYGLKRCGYATNPQYAKKLIKTIEDFRLQEYTYAALSQAAPREVLLASAQEKAIPRSRTVSTVVPGENIPVNDAYVQARGSNAPAEHADEIVVEKAAPQEQQQQSHVTEYYRTTTRNNLKGFFARKGDMLLEYAIRNRIRYARLLELNDLPDAPLEADMFIYLERKAKTGQEPSRRVEDGETLLQISQDEGIQLQQLRMFNHLEKGEEPVAGSILNLQTTGDKPEVYAAGSSNRASRGGTPRLSNDEGFVPAGRKPAAPEPAPSLKEEEEKETGTETAATTPARAQARVNIADEQPVEETIAAESTRQKPQKDESKMTALEKLKAHMDKTVYADRSFEPKSSGRYTSSSHEDPADTYATADEETVTTPAAHRAASRTTRQEPEPKKEIKSKAQEKKEKEQKLKAKAKSKIKSHTVRKGESLFEIAEKYDMSVSELQKLNKLGKKKTIQPGMKLKVAR